MSAIRQPGRRARRTDGGANYRRLIIPGILTLLIVLGLSAMEARLKGPVGGSDRLKGKR
ncbi:MAG: hypothetical protein FD129_2881, partial [bacterium]